MFSMLTLVLANNLFVLLFFRRMGGRGAVQFTC